MDVAFNIQKRRPTAFQEAILECGRSGLMTTQWNILQFEKKILSLNPSIIFVVILHT